MSFWQRIPLVIRAIAIGFAVSTLGVTAWVTVSLILPAPWSIGLMAILLWAFWKYFSGSGWPASTAPYRRESMRRTTLTPAVT